MVKAFTMLICRSISSAVLIDLVNFWRNLVDLLIPSILCLSHCVTPTLLLIDGMMRLGKDGHWSGRNTEKQLGPNTQAAYKTTHEKETSAETDTYISTSHH